jgi:hypothetical protein
MSYSVKPGNPLGRLGASIGRGLSEQVPQEIERTRLASGLKDLDANSSGMTPFQRLSKLSDIARRYTSAIAERNGAFEAGGDVQQHPQSARKG